MLLPKGISHDSSPNSSSCSEKACVLGAPATRTTRTPSHNTQCTHGAPRHFGMTSKAQSKKATSEAATPSSEEKGPAKELMKIQYRVYQGEHELDMLQELIKRDLSEPYSIFTYRYFLHGWPELCYLVCSYTFCRSVYNVLTRAFRTASLFFPPLTAWAQFS